MVYGPNFVVHWVLKDGCIAVCRDQDSNKRRNRNPSPATPAVFGCRCALFEGPVWWLAFFEGKVKDRTYTGQIIASSKCTKTGFDLGLRMGMSCPA